MESFGRYLRNEREQRGISVEDISRATKISPGQLKALESDELAALPTTTYVKGFIRAYSKHIGLDPNNTLLRFENYLQEIEQEDGGPIPQEYHVKQAIFRKDTPHLGIVIAGGGIILLVIVILMVLVRACGHSETSLLQRPGPAPSAQTAAPAPAAALIGKPPKVEELKPAESSQNDQDNPVIIMQPTVPPDAFQVRKTGPPLPGSALGRPKTPPDSTNPGGGNYFTR